MLVQIITQIGTPYRSMKRTEHLDRRCFGFCQQLLYKRPIFTHNISEISSGIVNPISVEVHFIVEQTAIQWTKGTECICWKQHAVGCIKCHHGFRPVHHLRHQECHCMLAEASCIALFDRIFPAVHIKTKLTHKHKCFFVADNFTFRITNQDFLKRSCMIRFHMIDNKIIQFSAIQNSSNVLKEYTAAWPVHGIKKNRFFI